MVSKVCFKDFSLMNKVPIILKYLKAKDIKRIKVALGLFY